MKGNFPEKQRITIGGRSLDYVLSGSGIPSIVLVNGHGMPLASWNRLYPSIEKIGTVLNYDRLGVGGSDKPDIPQTGEEIVGMLEALTKALGLLPPYILIGHSLGGLYTNLYTRIYPQNLSTECSWRGFR